MAEDNNKSTPEERLKQLDKILDEYENSLGLPKFVEQIDEEQITKYCQMSRTQMEALDVESCAEISLLLGGYAFHLQRAFNRENARVNWADNILKSLVSGRETQYRGNWESQFHQAVQGDEYTKKIFKIKSYAKNRADRIQFLSNSVKNISDLYVNLQRAKVRYKSYE